MLDKPVTFLATSNQSVARDFYEKKLDLEFVSADQYALVFNVGVVALRIQVVNAVVEVPYTSFGWAVSDIENTINTLSSRGVEFQQYENLQQDIQKIWHSPGGASIAWFKDPDSNTLSLTQYNV